MNKLQELRVSLNEQYLDLKMDIVHDTVSMIKNMCSEYRIKNKSDIVVFHSSDSRFIRNTIIEHYDLIIKMCGIKAIEFVEEYNFTAIFDCKNYNFKDINDTYENICELKEGLHG